ncbi:MAG: VOC family protein [Pseudomonadota bacterium]
MTNPAKIHALGEIAIRCRDPEAMKAFYRDVVGLEVMQDFKGSGITFFRIAPGFGGHTCVLALFAPDAIQRDVHESSAALPETGATSSLHHLALTVEYSKQDELCAFLDERGIPYNVEEFDWTGWRGVFVRDPDGNTVEFVAGGHKPA